MFHSTLRGRETEVKREDWLLLVVAAGDKPLTPVQLQKTLFLIKEASLPNLPDDFYDFVPYHFGPYDAQVYQDADALQERGLMVRHRAAGGTWTDTSITGSGRSKAEALEGELPEDSKNYLHKVVEWAQRLTFSQLVGAIYRKYPNYRANSVFQG